MKRLEGKTALIAGASTGMGRSCMEIFAREGATVFGVARTQANLDETLALVKQAGSRGHVFATDLATAEGAERAISAASSAFGGRIDILVNVASVGYSWLEKSPESMNDVVNTTPEKWHEVMAINLDSCFYMCRGVIPLMQKQKAGSIVNVASISGLLGLPVAHTYTAAKGAMINLTRSLCVTYAKDGIRSNVVCPGYTDTPMIAKVMHLFDDKAVAERLTPMARAGTSAEMAYGCLYFASDEASYCNGSVLVIDGGTAARQ